MSNQADDRAFWAALYGHQADEGRTETKTWVAFSAELLGHYEDTGAAYATRDEMRRVLREFGAIEGVKTTADLTVENVGKFVGVLRRRGLARATIVGRLSYLRAAANEAESRNLLDRSPFNRRRKWLKDDVDVEDDESRHHTPEDIARVLAYLNKRKADWHDHRLFVLLAIITHTMLRRDEVLYLRRSQCDFEACKIKVKRVADRQRFKKKAKREIPMPRKLAAILKDWFARNPDSDWVIPGARGLGPWTGGPKGHKPYERVRAVGQACGVPGFTMHSLRHSIATYLRNRRKVPASVLKDLMGHTTEATQRHYVHRDFSAMADAMRDFAVEASCIALH